SAGSIAAMPSAVLGTIQQAVLMVHWPEAGRAGSFRATDQAGRVVEPTWQDGLAYFGVGQEDRMQWGVEIAARLGHGASGGPVVDSAGSVVGVLVAGGTGKELTSAITLSDLIDFLVSSGLLPHFAPTGGGSAPDWSRTYETVAPSVVQV